LSRAEVQRTEVRDQRFSLRSDKLRPASRIKDKGKVRSKLNAESSKKYGLKTKGK